MAEVRTLGGLLEALRKRKGLTVKQLAALADVNYRTLVKYLRDERGMDLEVALPLFARVGWDAPLVARAAGLFAAGEYIETDDLDAPPQAPHAGATAAGFVRPISRELLNMRFAFETEARNLGAVLEDMDYINASLSDENILRLLGDASPNRPLSAEEQAAEMEIRLDELRAWLKRRVAIRKREARRR